MAGNSSGGAGFFIDSPWASASSAQGASSSRAATSASVRRLASSSQHEALVPLTLTSKQEQRLMSYIDDALLFLSRGYAKRYEPNSSTALASLTAYIEQVDQLLRIVTQIPPHGSALSLLTSYLLRITGDVVDHVPNYRLAVGFDDKHPMVEHKEQNPTQTRFAAILEELRASLVLLDLLDRAWNAILCGEQVVYEQAKSNAEQAIDAVAGGGKWRRKRRREDVDQEEKGAQQTHDQGVLVGEEEEETLETITSRRYHQSALDRAITATGRSGARDMAHPIQRDSAPILGTKGIRTVPQTDRVRLRNAIVLGKENLFIWMREAVNAPPPPRVIDEVTGRRLDLDLPRTESNGTEVQRQRLRELLVDQGNLNEDLSARHEVLKDEVDGADADAGAAAASRLDEAEQKEYNDALLAEEQEENLELEEVLPHREAPVPPVNDDEADKGGREEQEQEDGIEPTTEEGRHFKDLFDRKLDPDASDEDSDNEPRAEQPVESTDLPDPPKTAAAAASPSHSTSSSAVDLNDQQQPQQKQHREAMPEWDLAFSRLFRRTLQTLAEIDEELGKEKGDEKRQRAQMDQAQTSSMNAHAAAAPL